MAYGVSAMGFKMDTLITAVLVWLSERKTSKHFARAAHIHGFFPIWIAKLMQP